MKHVLAAVIVLSAVSGIAYSQSKPPMSESQSVHPGTAILDRMGIFAGNPAPTQEAASAADKSEQKVAIQQGQAATKP